MLESIIGWCGKLPIQADFMQSGQHPAIENFFMQWMIKGQNHLGEQLVKVNDHSQPIYFYFFSINSVYTDQKQRLNGLLFTSRDQRGRDCPFILFSLDSTSDNISNIYAQFFEQLEVLKFDMNTLHPKLNKQAVYTELKTQINQLNKSVLIDPTQDCWIELAPDFSALQLTVEKTNHIVYRKLMLR